MKKDHGIAIIKAGVAGIPIVGGTLASLLGDYVPTSTQKIIKDTMNTLSSKVNELEDRIDIENIYKEEFSELFKSTYLVIIRSHKKKKLNAAINLITNILLKKGDPEKLSYNELDHFARILDQLSIGALETLVTIAKFITDKYGGRLFDLYSGEPEDRRLKFEVIKNLQSGMHSSLLMGLVSELNSHNLLHIVGIPQIRTYSYENYPIELTILGVKFLGSLLKSELE